MRRICADHHRPMEEIRGPWTGTYLVRSDSAACWVCSILFPSWQSVPVVWVRKASRCWLVWTTSYQPCDTDDMSTRSRAETQELAHQPMTHTDSSYGPLLSSLWEAHEGESSDATGIRERVPASYQAQAVVLETRSHYSWQSELQITAARSVHDSTRGVLDACLVCRVEWSANHAAALGRLDVPIASSIPYRQYQPAPKAGPQAPRAEDIGRMIFGASHLAQRGRDVRPETCCPRPNEMVSMAVRAVLGSSLFVSLPCVHDRRAVICDHLAIICSICALAWRPCRRLSGWREACFQQWEWEWEWE